ncbi:MAG: CTP synthase C-terminal region-related (seleno)protein [Gaiellaceae bacterium]
MSDRVPSVRIAIVGDHDPAKATHRATDQAFLHLPEPPAAEWLATDLLEQADETSLLCYDGVLVTPGSPYRSMAGALKAIRVARKSRLPLLATCGGFQHVVVEYVRDVLGVGDADHEESNPTGPRLAVTALSCSLAGQEQRVSLVAGSRVASIHGAAELVEPFFCGYGLNPEYRDAIERAGLVVSGLGEDGEVRVVELAEHPFFVATLYVPQARSCPQAPHPLIVALVAAARARQASEALSARSG